MLRWKKPDGALSEDDLITAARRGDGDAFAALVERNKAVVYGLLLRLTKNQPDADDLFQETFLAAWRHLDSFAGSAKFSTWLCRLAINRFRDKCRAERARPAPASSRDEDDDELLRAETVAAVRAAIGELPDGLRDALVLREMYDLSYAEIAGRLGVPEGTVKSRIARARISLRKILEKRNFFAPGASNHQTETEGGADDD